MGLKGEQCKLVSLRHPHLSLILFEHVGNPFLIQRSYSVCRACCAPLYLFITPKTRLKTRSTFFSRARTSKTFSICSADSFEEMSGSCLTSSWKSRSSSQDFSALRCTQ